MKNMKTIFDSNKAITLIALVITIIVLLILAGVSIAMLTGENGILTKAATAKDMTDKEGLLEKVKIEVAASIGNNGKIDENQLANNLKNVDEIKTQVGNSVSLPEEFTTSDEKYIVSIDENGKVEILINPTPSPEEYFKKYEGRLTLKYNSEQFYSISEIVPSTTLIVSPMFKGEKIPYLGHMNSANVEKIIVKSGFESIIEFAFGNSANLREVILPDTITYVGGKMFEDCEKLEIVKLPSDLELIGPGVFSGCTSLESIELPSSLTTLEESVFLDCINLKEIIIPNTVTSIEIYAFSGCTSLERLKIPKSVTSLKRNPYSNIFEGCSNLKVTVEAGSTLTMEDFTINGLTEEQVIFE